MAATTQLTRHLLVSPGEVFLGQAGAQGDPFRRILLSVRSPQAQGTLSPFDSSSSLCGAPLSIPDSKGATFKRPRQI